MSTFNNVLIAITAIVILAAKLIELRLAIAKKKAETPTPTPATAHASRSHISLPPRFVSDVLLLITWFIFFVSMLSSTSTQVTRSDVAGLLVVIPAMLILFRKP